MKSYIIGTTVGLLLLMGTNSAVAWAMNGSPGIGRHKAPPPEAIEACKDESEGTVVEITTPREDKIKATCKQIDGQMVAVPEGGFRGPKVPPPGGPQSGQ